MWYICNISFTVQYLWWNKKKVGDNIQWFFYRGSWFFICQKWVDRWICWVLCMVHKSNQLKILSGRFLSLTISTMIFHFIVHYSLHLLLKLRFTWKAQHVSSFTTWWIEAAQSSAAMQNNHESDELEILKSIFCYNFFFPDAIISLSNFLHSISS